MSNKRSRFDSMFRECDIRGRVSEDELNDESVYSIVSAYAHFLIDRGIKHTVVGYDNRKCSLSFANASIKALVSRGIDVFYIGLCVTPTIYYAQYIYECEGACMITASHNPDGWSGFKFGKGYSKTLEPDDVREVYDYTCTSDVEGTTRSGMVSEKDDIWESYVSAIVSRIYMGERKPRIVLDAGNGGAGLYAYEIFQRLGCVIFQLNCDPDMDYPHYFPNPSDIAKRKKLKELVVHPYIRADIGLSFDGDGDCLGVVDQNGADIYSDIILAILSKRLLSKTPCATVVYDVKCSQVVQNVVAQSGGTPLMWKTRPFAY